MKSIQRRVTAIVLASILAMVLAAGGSLFVYVRLALLHQLDRSMESQARVLASTVHTHLDGRLTLGEAEAAIGWHRGNRPPKEAFEICTLDGKTLLRSASLGNSDITHDLPNISAFGTDVTLPDGRAARVRRLKFIPTLDDDDPPLAAATAPSITRATSIPLLIILAHDREEIDETLGTILTSLVITALLLSAAISMIIPHAVRRGLLPVRQIASAVEQIHIDSLSNHFSPGQMPAELAPICNRLNDLLARLHDAFARERRFSSDVAHELRTPIAELRSMAEVALRWPPDAPAMEQNFRETLAVAKQMEAVVGSLLTIARCEAGAQSTRISSFPVNDAIADAWAPHEASADARSLEMDWQLRTDTAISTDRTMFVQLLSNLFSNAVAYSTGAGKLRCCVETSPHQTQLTISNPTDQITADDLPSIFDAFWRKDVSRTDSSRSGLGLSIVATYARVLGIKLQATLTDGRFSLTISLPSAVTALPAHSQHETNANVPAPAPSSSPSPFPFTTLAGQQQ